MEDTPNVIGGCRIVEKLGQGGMGAVYLARHQTLGREVALKLLPGNLTEKPEYVMRFLREARAAASLKHPNIVQVYDAGDHLGQYYISMEYIEGSSMAAKLAKEGPLPERDGLQFLAQSAQGLGLAHAAGLVHRDVKPENLLFETKTGLLKIADFGLVSSGESDSALTQSGAMLGTPMYMSPEQCEGHLADMRSDLYSLGASFFRLMTGSAPFNAPTPMGVLFKHRYEAPPHPRQLNPNLSEGASQILLKLMAKNPAERFQNCDELLSAIDMALRALGDPGLRLAVNAHTPVAVGAMAMGASPSGAGNMATPQVMAVQTPPPGMPGSPTMFATPPGLAAGAAPGAGPAMTPVMPNPNQQPMFPNTPAPYSPQAMPMGPNQAPMYTTPLPPGMQMGPNGTMQQPQYGPGGTMPQGGMMPQQYGPGGTLPQNVTPMPQQPARKSRAGLFVATFLLLALAGAGAYFYFVWYPDSQVKEALSKARDLRSSRNYKDALEALDTGLKVAPANSDLLQLHDDIETDSINARVAELKEQGKSAYELKKYADAAKNFGEALELQNSKSNLAGVTKDPQLPDWKKKTEDLRDFTDWFAKGQAAEAEKNYDSAVESYTNAAKYEGKTDGQAAQAAGRARFLGLMDRAATLERNKDYKTALDKLNEAAKLNIKDISNDIKRLQARIHKQTLIAEADGLAVNDPAGAAAKLQQAAVIFPQDPQNGDLLDRAKTLQSDGDFRAAVKNGDQAMAAKQYGDAVPFYTQARQLRGTDQEVAAKLFQAQVGLALWNAERAPTARESLKLYQKVLDLDPNNGAAKQRIADIQGKVDRLEKAFGDAQKAENQKDWNKAISAYQEMIAIDPQGKEGYEARINSARAQGALTDAQSLLKAGQLEQALAAAETAAKLDAKLAAPVMKAVNEAIAQREAAARAAKEAAERAAAEEKLLADVIEQVKQGQIPLALQKMDVIVRTNPNLQGLFLALQTVDRTERNYDRLEALRQSGQASLDGALKGDDDDKEVKKWVHANQAWQQKFQGSKTAARQAWIEKRLNDINPAFAAMQTQANDLANWYTTLSGNFGGKAASTAKPKANIGGILGGVGRHGGGAIGGSGDVGADTKLAGIYDATGKNLARLADEIRAVPSTK